jgi:polar amino acid transport system substrate-binding protein
VTVEVGEELGRRLGVPTALVEYRRAAEVVDGIAAGQVDMTVTNATPVRAEKVAFTSPLLALELGFLLPTRSSFQNASNLDDPQYRVGVTQGDASERTIQAVLKHAVIVPVPTSSNAKWPVSIR